MTDSEDGQPSFSKSLPRACDNCRVRKVRCDKTTPCSNCRTAGVACKITSRQNDITKSRSRVLISNQYEQKIDRMERRLESIEKLLQTLVSKSSTSVDAASSSVAITPAGATSAITSTPQVEQFEGESSLVAHSRQAQEALHQLLESAPTTIRNDPNTVSALAALRAVLEKHRSEPPFLDLLRQNGSLQNLQFSELPPREEVVKMLRCIAADDLSNMFTWWLYENVEQFSRLYDEFCQSPSTCPLSISIIVYCALWWLTDGNPILARAGFDTQSYARYVPVCERHLSACISSYSLFVEASELNITALSAAAAYAIYMADVNAAWTITSTAARLCQSLGWHRLAAKSSDERIERKATLFWSIYFLDKSLSLRLGRSSVLQDYDISTNLDDLFGYWSESKTDEAENWKAYVKMCMDMAVVQGLIYDKLYSPGSLKSLSDRQKLGQELVTRIHEVLVSNNNCFANTSWLHEYTRFYQECNEVILYCLFTLVYRAMPEVSNAHQLSLQAARSTMQVHYRCSKRVEAMGPGLRVEYMTWSILLCPFTPFIVLFRNVITELNLDDLKLLEDFVRSIEWLEDKNQRESLQRFQQLCQAFYNLAKHFVAARLRADGERQVMTATQQTLTGDAMQQLPTFDGQLGEMTIPDDFQAWMDDHMDFLNNDWLAFGAL